MKQIKDLFRKIFDSMFDAYSVARPMQAAIIKNAKRTKETE